MLDTEVLKLIEKGITKAVGDLREQLAKANTEIATLRKQLAKADSTSLTKSFWDEYVYGGPPETLSTRQSPSGGLFKGTETGGAPLLKVSQSPSGGLFGDDSD
jgi:hypothetical protein